MANSLTISQAVTVLNSLIGQMQGSSSLAATDVTDFVSVAETALKTGFDPGKMIFNCMDWKRDTETPKIHPTQKPVELLQRLISIFSDEGEVVIDPCCGSGSTLLAAQKMSRKSFGFEVDRNFFNAAKDKVLASFEPDMLQALKYSKTN